MIYKKPSNVTYTQMAIWIDKNIYTENCNDDTVFEYLFHLTNMLAHKQNYFKRTEYYEDFAIYTASAVFLRLKNPKQFEYDEKGEPKLPRIKSVLNYLKKILYPKKVDFEQEFYSQAVSITQQEEDYYDLEYSFADKMCESIDELSMVEFNMCLNDVAKTARAYLSKIPYKKDKATWNNIYTSCLLSFLNSVTLENKDILRLKDVKCSDRARMNMIENLYNKESKDSTILYHLDENMRDYITVLTRSLKHAIAKDLSLTFHTYVPAGAGMKSLIMSEINNDYYNGEDYNN